MRKERHFEDKDDDECEDDQNGIRENHDVTDLSPPPMLKAIAIAAKNSVPVSDITPTQPVLAQNRPPTEPKMLDPR